jgi:hypothetical protein
LPGRDDGGLQVCTVDVSASAVRDCEASGRDDGGLQVRTVDESASAAREEGSVASTDRLDPDEWEKCELRMTNLLANNLEWWSTPEVFEAMRNMYDTESNIIRKKMNRLMRHGVIEAQAPSDLLRFGSSWLPGIAANDDLDTMVVRIARHK